MGVIMDEVRDTVEAPERTETISAFQDHPDALLLAGALAALTALAMKVVRMVRRRRDHARPEAASAGLANDDPDRRPNAAAD
ncbi:hypothetical protein [Intrasporangium oryzae]|nr:hypothetical protein [Intrasporangium oryzae]